MFSRTLLIAAAALTLSAGGALAQNPPSAGGPAQDPGGGIAAMAQRRVGILLQGITLTPAQRARVDSLVTATVAQMPAMTPGTPPDSATRFRRRELTMRQDSTLRALLTPEQQTVWDRNLQNMRQGGGRRP